MTPSISLLAITIPMAGAVAQARFVTQAGAYPAAGAAGFGVTRTSAAAAGDLVAVDVQGTAAVEAGAACAVDAPLMLDAQGRVVPLTAGGKFPVGRAMQAAAAAGAIIEVLLVPNAGVPSGA